MRKPDPVAALTRAGAASRNDRLRLAPLVEVVEVPAGAVAAPAGVRGRWLTAVLDGAVATTDPPAVHRVGDVVEHGPETALVAVTDCRLATTTTALEPSLARLLLPPGSQAEASSAADTGAAAARALPLTQLQQAMPARPMLRACRTPPGWLGWARLLQLCQMDGSTRSSSRSP